MPGILPMKVIKVGTTAQSRIAQACDRCRSKKIRCDGIRPCCSQCANVGFECKTSDKLSRRAFPRGYTESLEERVRVLEGETRELKDLLDEKDEKIDMLSRMHNNRRISNSPLSSSPVVIDKPADPPANTDDTFRVQAVPLQLESDVSDSTFMGPSTGRTFVDAFKLKLRDSGKSCSGYDLGAFLAPREESVSRRSSSSGPNIPPRMFSDRCINIFWQEHAPLFPVLHKPTFLRLYEEYIADPEQMVDDQKLAELHLVFSIAGFSSDLPDKDHIARCEEQWRRSLNAVLMESTLGTLQCLVLACLYCSQTGQYKSLQTYKAIAVGLAQRLGLHQSQKRFSYGALTIETRKKVFWSLYTVDCFSAASMGLPQLLQDSDIDTEYPLPIDDEYVEERGYLPTLPGETSKISSALALFSASRILSKVLQSLYPANTSKDLSLNTMTALENELNEWSEQLPPNLKLTFVQDKPSTDVTGNRSALLSLAYYHIRGLIHRPAVGSTLGEKASPSLISVAESSKHAIQIIQLLEERSMSFSFCVNKNEMLTLCGLSLLYQGLDLKKEGKLLKDGQRLVKAVEKYLDAFKAPGAADFRKLVSSLAPSETQNHAVAQTHSQTGRQAHVSVTSRYTNPSSLDTELLQQQERMRRATLNSLPMLGLGNQSGSRHKKPDSTSRSKTYHSSTPRPAQQLTPTPSLVSTSSKPRSSSSSEAGPNLNYLALSSAPSSDGLRRSRSVVQQRNNEPQPQQYKTSNLAPSEWEALLGSLDSGSSNIFDAVYGASTPNMPVAVQGGANTAVQNTGSLSSSGYGDWDLSPEAWDITALSMGDCDASATTQSVLSLSEESLSSGDDLDFGVPGVLGEYKQSLLQGGLNGDGFYVDGLDGNFGLS
ncbi:hypothetical protein V494_06187 [Pseudogymnoascus sp. VKM F-4513 (FW-928)]|nr:hypothetical protein V494_06187 [Pseudogymnoascus sp. VKM F-4513 (FW-928)]